MNSSRHVIKSRSLHNFMAVLGYVLLISITVSPASKMLMMKTSGIILWKGFVEGDEKCVFHNCEYRD